MQDSLGGNSKTSLVVTCTVSSLNMTETLSSLRFGSYAQHIQNRSVYFCMTDVALCRFVVFCFLKIIVSNQRPRINEERSLSDYKQRLQKVSNCTSAEKY
jgi:predicted transglutaminase-like protease